MPRRIFDPLHRCNSGGVPAFSSSARAGAAASAAARGLGFLSLFVSSSTQASRLMHLSKHGGSLLGGIMRIISSRAPAATGSRGVSHRPARCGRLLLCSEHGSRGGAGPCEVGNDSSSNQDNRIRRRRRGGLAPRAQNLPLHHSRSDSRTRNRRTSGSVGGPWWGTGALMSTSTSAGDPSAAAAAADSGDGVAAGAGDRTAEGASGEGVAGPGEGEEQRRRVEGMVSSISPSAIAAFKQCPQLFYYRRVAPVCGGFSYEIMRYCAGRFGLVHRLIYTSLCEEARYTAGGVCLWYFLAVTPTRDSRATSSVLARLCGESSRSFAAHSNFGNVERFAPPLRPTLAPRNHLHRDASCGTLP